MKISFNPQIKINTIKKYPTFCSQKSELKPLGQDVYFSGVKKAQQTNYEKKYSALYDKVYDEVIEQYKETYCPLLKEIKLIKPTFEIVNGLYERDKLAEYDPNNNKIRILRRKIDNNYYICYQPEKKEYCVLSETESLTDKLSEVSSKIYQLETYGIIVLNPQEKDIYISSILAHEINHYIAFCLMALSEETSEDIISHCSKNKFDSLNGPDDFFCQLDKDFLLEENQFFEYDSNTVLFKNAKKKFSALEDDDRYFSAKNYLYFFLKKEEELKKPQEHSLNFWNAYNILEVDAINYENEYILSKLNSVNATDVNKELLKSIAESRKIYSEKMLSRLEQECPNNLFSIKNKD